MCINICLYLHMHVVMPSPCCSTSRKVDRCSTTFALARALSLSLSLARARSLSLCTSRSLSIYLPSCSTVSKLSLSSISLSLYLPLPLAGSLSLCLSRSLSLPLSLPPLALSHSRVLLDAQAHRGETRGRTRVWDRSVREDRERARETGERERRRDREEGKTERERERAGGKREREGERERERVTRPPRKPARGAGSEHTRVRPVTGARHARAHGQKPGGRWRHRAILRYSPRQNAKTRCWPDTPHPQQPGHRSQGLGGRCFS